LPRDPDSTLMKNREVYRFRKNLMGWYDKYQRSLPWRKTSNPYHVWVSEVMLQQTQVNTVIPYYLKFIRRFPDVQTLARADLRQVLKAWEGLGYYARARNLHRAANMVAIEFQGDIPDTAEAFQRLPGVGAYIASAVQSIAFNHPLPVVDGNVKRVLARLFEIDTPINGSGTPKAFFKFAECLIDMKQPGKFNQAIMELGAMICRPKRPDCAICPVRSSCKAQKNQKIEDFPVRLKSKSVPEYHVSVGVVRRNGRVLITQRSPEGLLGGLWEFPGGRIRRKERPEQACIRELKEEVNLKAKIDTPVTQIRHAYSHFKIRMDVFLCGYVSGKVRLNGPVDYRWISPKEIGKYPFPRANHKFFPALLAKLNKRIPKKSSNPEKIPQ
jgi:A/G-specific adenine glycosylase